MGAISNLQIVKPPQKNTCQILLPQKISESKAFWEGRFGLKMRIDFAYRVYMGLEGTTGVYERIYHFSFK